MSEPSNKLNLTVQERRIVIGIFLVVLFVLNYLFVWPHFGEWSRTRKQLHDMYSTMSNWNADIKRDIDPAHGYKVQLAELERQGGAVHMEAQVQLQQTIHQQAVRTGVNVNNYTPTSTRGGTNAFFEDQSTEITFDSQEPQLINFLYNIGNDPAMVRVSELSLRPADQNRYRLQGTITLTASYAKRPEATAPAANKPEPHPAGAKPVVAGKQNPRNPPNPRRPEPQPMRRSPFPIPPNRPPGQRVIPLRPNNA